MNDSLGKELVSYTSLFNEEIIFKTRMLNLLNRFNNCFERSLMLGHFTASAWILSPDHSKVVLLHHKKLNRWLQPGGHADGDKDLLAVSRKEALEETGLANLQLVKNGIFDLDIHTIPSNSKDPTHFHYDVRYAFTSANSEVTVSHESNRVEWVNLNEISTEYNVGRSILRMVEKTKGLQ